MQLSIRNSIQLTAHTEQKIDTIIWMGVLYVTGPAKIDHVSTKNRRFLACLLYHNLMTIYTTATKSSQLLQNLMGFLLELTEM